ncbi:MAG TPA: hypothetical protein ENJ79_01585 [Gammaproteobacteria bacterium]|nr:hypothetical protein [Gammaproteobacteria bacterium]
MHRLMENIGRYLMSCRELTAFCAHNGWIDDNTLYYEILEQDDHQVIALVQFDEVLENDGAPTERLPCQGRLRLVLDRFGQVASAELL